MVSDKQQKILDEVTTGACVPQLSALGRNLDIPTSTIKYNIEQLEDNNVILDYIAITDPNEHGLGYEGFLLVNLDDDAYANPEAIATDLAQYDKIRTAAVITGEYEILLYIRHESMNAYFNFIKSLMDKHPLRDLKTLSCLKVVKEAGIPRR